MVKKDKDDANCEYREKILKEKTKSYNSSFVNQAQTQASKKDKRGRQRGDLAIGVNATKVVKKTNNKAKDLSHIECYTYK